MTGGNANVSAPSCSGPPPSSAIINRYIYARERDTGTGGGGSGLPAVVQALQLRDESARTGDVS